MLHTLFTNLFKINIRNQILEHFKLIDYTTIHKLMLPNHSMNLYLFLSIIKLMEIYPSVQTRRFALHCRRFLDQTLSFISFNKHYTMFTKPNTHYYLTIEPYKDIKMKKEEKESIEKMLTQILNGNRNCAIMKLTVDALKQIGVILQNFGIIEIKGSCYLYLFLIKILGKKCVYIKTIFGYGADTDAAIYLYKNINATIISKIVDVIIDYSIKLDEELRRNGVLHINNRRFGYERMNGARSSLIKNFVHSLCSIKYQDLKMPLKYYMSMFLTFPCDNPKGIVTDFNLFRVKSVFIDIDSKQIYNIEHLDISIDISMSDRSMSLFNLQKFLRNDHLLIDHVYFPDCDCIMTDIKRLIKYSREPGRLRKCQTRLIILEAINRIWKDHIKSVESQYKFGQNASFI